MAKQDTRCRSTFYKMDKDDLCYTVYQCQLPAEHTGVHRQGFLFPVEWEKSNAQTFNVTRGAWHTIDGNVDDFTVSPSRTVANNEWFVTTPAAYSPSYYLTDDGIQQYPGTIEGTEEYHDAQRRFEAYLADYERQIDRRTRPEVPPRWVIENVIRRERPSVFEWFDGVVRRFVER